MRSDANQSTIFLPDNVNYPNISYFLDSPFSGFWKRLIHPTFFIDPSIQSLMHNFSAKSLTVRYLAQVSIKKLAVGDLNYQGLVRTNSDKVLKCLDLDTILFIRLWHYSPQSSKLIVCLSVHFTSTFKIVHSEYRFISFAFAASMSLASIRIPPSIPPDLVLILNTYFLVFESDKTFFHVNFA